MFRVRPATLDSRSVVGRISLHRKNPFATMIYPEIFSGSFEAKTSEITTASTRAGIDAE
jgi:hypothetical protein